MRNSSHPIFYRATFFGVKPQRHEIQAVSNCETTVDCFQEGATRWRARAVGCQYPLPYTASSLNDLANLLLTRFCERRTPWLALEQVNGHAVLMECPQGGMHGFAAVGERRCAKCGELPTPAVESNRLDERGVGNE